jgi:hypothetical protein
MNKKALVRMASVAVGLSLLCWGTFSQPFAPRPGVPVPTPTGNYLLCEASDLRKNLFEGKTIDDRVRRGVVSHIRPDFLVTKEVIEHSTNTWNTVSNALRQLGMLERKQRTPQIRIVQRDRILQSSMDSRVGSGSGFSSWFLDSQLQAGDAVVITLVSE